MAWRRPAVPSLSMTLLLLALSISLGTAFPEASAEATPDGSGLSVELTVAVDSALSPTTVVAHIGTSTNQSTFQLGPEGDNVYSGILASPARNQFVIVEAIFPDGSAEFSQTVTLAELGVERSLLGMTATPPGDGSGPSRPDRPGLLLPVLLVAVALAAGFMTVRVFRRGVQ